MRKGIDMKKLVGTVLASLAAVSAAKAQSLEDRVTELEVNQSLNIFKFSGALINRYDNLKSKSEISALSYNAESAANTMRMKFQFNIDADISSKLKFYSTLVTTKSWNLFARQDDDLYRSYFNWYPELMTSSEYRENLVKLEKAYFDYSILPELAFSMGRLPTSYGSPTHMVEGRARMGTYPKLSYSAAVDGAALTYKIIKNEKRDLALRGVYVPFTTRNFSSPTATVNYRGFNKITTQPDVNTGYAVMLDYNMRDSFAREFNFIVQYMDLGTVRISDFKSTAGTYYSDSQIALKFTNFHAEASDILDTGISLALSYMATSLNSKGCFYKDTTDNGTATDSTCVGGFYANANATATGVDKDLSGSIMLATLTYRLPIDFMNRPTLGVEYQQGSDEATGYDWASDNLTGFYVNRGTGYHLFYNQKLEDNLTFILGYMHSESKINPVLSLGPSKTPNSTIGALSDYMKTTYDNVYTSLRLDF